MNWLVIAVIVLIVLATLAGAKRGLVKTEVINGRIQVDIQSFEEWLASQSVYSKVRRDENV